MLASRRNLVAGLATLPVIATAATTIAIADSAAASVDPILAAYAAAEVKIFVSFDALVATPPRTIAVCMALVDFMVEDADGVEGRPCLNS